MFVYRHLRVEHRVFIYRHLRIEYLKIREGWLVGSVVLIEDHRRRQMETFVNSKPCTRHGLPFRMMIVADLKKRQLRGANIMDGRSDLRPLEATSPSS